jgi:hypothetical protein
MYYSHPCSYCTKIFYTFHSDRRQAASILYYGIKQHLIDYDEDHKEYQFDDGSSIDINEVYAAVNESDDEPSGGYEL